MSFNEENQVPAGLSQSTIDNLERVEWDKECRTEECPVCQEEYAEKVLMIKLPCKHLFHPDCIIGWLKINGTCPVCRYSLLDNPIPIPTQPEVD